MSYVPNKSMHHAKVHDDEAPPAPPVQPAGDDRARSSTVWLAAAAGGLVAGSIAYAALSAKPAKRARKGAVRRS